MPLAGLGLLVALVLQLHADGYHPSLYWLTVVMVAIFGTMAADVLHIGLGIPYLVSATGFGLVLTGLLWAWYTSEHTLSIHSIDTHRREVFYWAVVLATFALGTATGEEEQSQSEDDDRARIYHRQRTYFRRGPDQRRRRAKRIESRTTSPAPLERPPATTRYASEPL